MQLLTSLRSSVSISRQNRAKEGNSKCTVDEDVAQSSSVSRTFRSLPQELLDAIKPLVVLLQAHSRKTYYEWALDTLTQDTWQITSKDRPTQFHPVRKLLLVGTEVIAEAEGLGACKVSLVEENDRMQRSGIEVSGQVLSLNGGEVVFSCTNPSSLKDMEKLCLLSIFEYYSILKSVTGTIISSLGIMLSDMHVVLSSAFNYKDWCEIYLQDQGWVKVWCHIDKVGKKSSGSQPTGRYQIKFYTDKKQTSSGNLICFIPDCEYTQDIFFYKNCQLASPDYSQMDLQDFLENLTMIKIVGNVCFPQEGFHKNRSRSSSTLSFLNGNETSSRRSSIVASPNSTSSRLKALSPTRGQHRRKTSELSLDSNHSYYKDLENCIIDPKGLLVRPLSHNGVHHLEAMIRMIIPMMDCTRLYGRPALFKSDRNDPDSLMFGLPKLPTVDYFAKEELNSLHNSASDAAKFPSTDSNAIAMHYYSRLLHEKMTQDPHRDRKLSFRQLASIAQQEKEQLPVLDSQEESFLGSLNSLMV
ncbi:hypothetical protein HG537_0E04810 [Torulaspora globosa]|uniref:Skg3/CAF120-like PH-like domain-containing protein n=1 Tax=Torulaspora globosa TaxID=48254 RepID=A0A7H9HW38_9SACH|nr:hypothetical protein HG537_0E04810 [Torulaspora sp. CBS 2947]